jgi:hypothetical protein
MPLCVCYNCGRKMDCSPEGMCELCEADLEGLRKWELDHQSRPGTESRAPTPAVPEKGC